jgi:pimeloyl-ACP methyl ester carboxylesterase
LASIGATGGITGSSIGPCSQDARFATAVPRPFRRAAELMRDARLEVVEGGHAPFLDEPERCAQLIRRLT